MKPLIACCLLGLAGCSAVPDDGRPLTDVESRPTAMAAPAVNVCELVGRDSIVRIRATGAGTRYTLCTLDGRELAPDLEARHLAELRPDLDPRAMQADWGKGPLMMADLPN